MSRVPAPLPPGVSPGQGVGIAGIYVRDQDEAIDFYLGKLGFASTRTRATAASAG